MKWVINTPSDFHFQTTVKGHGWYRLSPFYYFEDEKKLIRIEELLSGRVIQLFITSDTNQEIVVATDETKLADQENKEILNKVRWMFRLDENFQPFYDLCLCQPEMAFVIEEKQGRLLRSSTLFEDFIKVMLTTNTTWVRTISMVSMLVEKLGKSLPSNPLLHGFPTPDAILEKGKTYLKEEVRLGYRSDYLYDFVLKIEKGLLNLDTLPQEKTEELIKILKSIKGIGPYAQSTLLMILGHYDQLPVDSEFRKHVRLKYFNGKDPTPKEISTLYSDWGKYKYLAYWFDRKA